MILRFSLSCWLLLLLQVMSAQGLGLRRPGTDLQFIESDTVRVIFEKGQEAQATRVANIVHKMAQEYPLRGGADLRKISIILQNETDIPNGYVGLAPWRSEFYMSPPAGNFELGSLPWADLLAIHEFRHVQQRSAARTGLSAAAYYIFGEDFFSAVVNVSWPNWYTEGDAVISETALSQQGRGRLPAFLNGYRSKVNGGPTWKYMKARNGSFKDFVPTHYHLGFLLQNYGRLQYGQEFWDNVAIESARYKGLFYPFSRAVKRVAGVSTRDFYLEAMDHYRSAWSEPIASLSSSPFVEVKHDRYEDHSYPVRSSDGQLYVMVNTYDRIPGIYRVQDGVLEFVVNTGIQSDMIFSANGGKICWAEYRWHPRWEREDHSTIIVCDANGKNKRKLSHRQSYFSPALSPDGSRIAALYDNDSQLFTMHILDAGSGDLIGTLPNPHNYYYSYPVWTDDGSAIVSTLRDTIGRTAIAMQDVASGAISILTNWDFKVRGRPAQDADWIYFTMGEDHLDKVYRVHTEDGRLEVLDGSVESLYQPVMVNGELVYSQFSTDGKRLQSILDPEPEFVAAAETAANSYLAIMSSESDLLQDLGSRTYDSHKYGLFRQPVFVHSWRPIFDDPIYSLELQSLNVLQSIEMKAGVQWNSNENDFGPYAELALGMWYPEILFGYSGWQRDFVRDSDGQKFKWFEHSINTGLRIPFKSLHGPYVLNGAVTSRIQRLMATGDAQFDLNFLSHRFYIQHRQRLAPKHPITRFGQAIDITFPHSIDADTASQFQVKSDFTFPSPIRNHVLWLQFDYRYESLDNSYRFGDNFNYARGYDPLDADWNYRIGINYQLPLVYPDWGFGGIVYFKRIRANLFTDLSTASANDVRTDYNSVGAELIFDVEFLNVEPFTFGIRYSYLLQEGLSGSMRHQWGVFVPTSRI